MAGQIDIYNMALGNIGINKPVADLDENSVERKVCSRYYETARDAALADFPWPFATTTVLLADLGNPPTNWAFRYRYPNDCLRADAIVVPGCRDPRPDQEIEFEVMYEAAGRVIVTDQPEAELRYVKRIDSAERLPANVVEAISLKLAAMIAMPLKAELNLRSAMEQLYERYKQDAWAQAMNESEPDNPPPLPDYITGMR